MRFAVYQVSRKGGREKNEDRVGYCYTREAGLFALADGMGGHPEGELAAQLAMQTLAGLFQRAARPALSNPLRFLTESLIAAHAALLRHAAQNALRDTPRTTIVACVLQGNAAYWAHCGDSRLYLVRGGKLVVRTRDHSYAELHGAAGRTEGSASDLVKRSVLFTCLGSPIAPVINSAGPQPLQRGDRILLCSDGLWGKLDDALVTQYLWGQPIASAVPDLVELALRHGGANADNASAVTVEWDAAQIDADTVGVSTLGLADEAFTSTIEARSCGQDAADDLDEAQIERSIREINDAIRRTPKTRR